MHERKFETKKYFYSDTEQDKTIQGKYIDWFYGRIVRIEKLGEHFNVNCVVNEA